MHPQILISRNHEAQKRLRASAQWITEAFGNQSAFPVVPGVAQAVAGHKKDVQTLKQHEALADILAIAVRVFDKIGPDLVQSAAEAVAAELIAESAAQVEAIADEPAPEVTPEEPSFEGKLPYRIVETFTVGDGEGETPVTFEAGQEILIDPIQFVDWIAEGKVVAINPDPNPATPEVTPEPAPVPDPSADPNPAVIEGIPPFTPEPAPATPEVTPEPAKPAEPDKKPKKK